MEGTGSSWKQPGQDINGEAVGDTSGIYVSISSDDKTLSIGANDNDGNGSAAAGGKISRALFLLI